MSDHLSHPTYRRLKYLVSPIYRSTLGNDPLTYLLNHPWSQNQPLLAHFTRSRPGCRVAGPLSFHGDQARTKPPTTSAEPTTLSEKWKASP